MRGIVFDDLDVAGQAGARVRAFDQVMTEQGIAREAPVEHAMHRIHFIDAFAGEDAFSVQVLIHVGNGARINIETGFSRIQAGQAGTGGALHAHSHPRLQNAVAGHHDVLFRIGIDDRLVQGMRHRADHAIG